MIATRARTRHNSSAAELDDLTLVRAQERATRGVSRARRSLRAAFLRARVQNDFGVEGRDRVEDLAQETFLRAFRALPRFDVHGRARLSTWILTIATRVVIDQNRRKEPPREPSMRPTFLRAPPEPMTRSDAQLSARH